MPLMLTAVRALAGRARDVRLIADDTRRAEAIEAEARFLPWKRPPVGRDQNDNAARVDCHRADPRGWWPKSRVSHARLKAFCPPRNWQH